MRKINARSFAQYWYRKCRKGAVFSSFYTEFCWYTGCCELTDYHCSVTIDICCSTSGHVCLSSCSDTKPISPKSAASDAIEGPEYTDLPHTNMRRTIAKRLAESKASIPHTYASTNCVMDNLLATRQGFEVKVSVNDFIIKAAAMSLRKVPEMNAVWNGEEAQLLNDVDISVAVATDAGLITPIVKAADNLKVVEISSTLKVMLN